jgi:hypothetical protein
MTHTTYRAGTVYANAPVRVLDAVQGVIRGYVFIWGSPNGETGVGRDSYDTYFSKAAPPVYSASGSLAGYPVCLEHGQENGNTQPIGTITRTWFDDVGLVFEAQLDRSDPRFTRTVERVRSGVYKTSSSSAEHMADFDDDGAFRSWMMTELSLVEHPSQEEMPPVQLVRSNAEGARDARRVDASMGDTRKRKLKTEMEKRMDVLDPINDEDVVMLPTDEGVIAVAEEDVNAIDQAVAGLVQEFGLEAVLAVLEQMAQVEAPAPEAEAGGEEPHVTESAPGFPRSAKVSLTQLRAALQTNVRDAKIAKLQKEMDAMRKTQQAAVNAAPARETSRAVGQHISVSEPRRFWGRSTSDLLLAHQLMNSREFRARGVQASEEFRVTLAGRALGEVQKNKGAWGDLAVRSAFPRATRANEVAISTAANGGDEWVGIAYSTELWEKVRNNRIY